MEVVVWGVGEDYREDGRTYTLTASRTHATASSGQPWGVGVWIKVRVLFLWVDAALRRAHSVTTGLGPDLSAHRGCLAQWTAGGPRSP